ncbi:MAG TPA: VWA domain-containing protein [Bryobacteraceae bacterium]|jgi:Ca-activated chloride channel family protein|nr:VWA domain-containing protein [Bryobacteraceae bacterium]
MNIAGFRWALLAALVCTSFQPVQAQFKPAHPPPESAPEQPTFAIRVNLVRLLVSVQDAAGAVISDLTRNDFDVYDSGVPQKLAVFERNTSLPLSVAILIDTSGSTMIDLHYEVESVLRFIPTLLDAGNQEDTFALFSFNWRTNLEADYSRSAKRADRALHALKGEGGTSLYDAVYLASDTLQGREGRHVIVVVTDGGDTTSYKHYEDALNAAQHADVVMYPIVVVPIANDAGRNTGGEHALATLATATGGRIFYPEGFEKLDQAFKEILRDLRTQYLLAFYPDRVPATPGIFHSVAVQTHRTDLHIRARSGYYTPK